MVLTVITLRQDTSPAFIQSQLCDECQESRWGGGGGKGWDPNVLINILKQRVRMSKPHFGLFV